MFDLFVVSEAARQKVAATMEPKRPRSRKRERERPRRNAVRSTSAAALRGLAERLEPSPSR
jgi:hypothetical protein